MADVSGPQAVVEACVAWLDCPAVRAAGARTVQAWLPPLGEPSRVTMPAVCVHLEELTDQRIAFNGAGGLRQRAYPLAADVWWSVTAQHVEGAQAGCADLVEAVIDRLADDPSWDGAVSHSGPRFHARVLEDTYDALLAGRGVFAWRIRFSADLFPFAT